MHHVILGAGPAGVTAAETIRGLDRNARITVIGGEGEPPYSRMAIPYLLHGSIEEKGTYLRQKSGHYESLGIEVLNARAGGIDSAARTLHLSGGDPITYDRLLIATGATPLVVDETSDQLAAELRAIGAAPQVWRRFADG